MAESTQRGLSAEYSRWWKRLTIDERRQLIASGAFKADAPQDGEAAQSRARVNGQHFDFNRAETEKSYSDASRDMSMLAQSPSAIDDVIAREAAGLDDPRLAELDMASLRLRATLHFLLEGLDESSDKAMHLHADIIRLVVGEGTPPRMTALAKLHGVSKAAVSLRCRKLLRRLGLEPSCFMRSNDDANTMRISAIVRNSGIKLSEESKRVIAKNFRPRPTPGKESFLMSRESPTRSRPRKIEAKNLSFPKGSDKARQTSCKPRK